MNAPRTGMFGTMLFFEATLAVVALGLAEWLQPRDLPRLELRGAGDLGQALAVALPPLAALWLALRAQSGPLAQVREEARLALGELLAGRGPGELLLLAAAAGLGEELLFRGVLQSWLTQHVGWAGGVALAALLFGACHAMSLAYFLYAAALGGYFGLATAWTHSLAGPVFAHAAVDFIALLALRPPSGPEPKRYNGDFPEQRS